MACLTPCHAQVSSSGTEFWLCFLENVGLGVNGDPHLYVVISAETDAIGSLATPSDTIEYPFSVVAGGDTVIELPVTHLYPTGNGIPYNRGLKITADAPVSVHAIHHRQLLSDATLVLPIGELGTDYTVVTHDDLTNMYRNEFAVLATQDSCLVEVDPSVPTNGGILPGIPDTVMLHAGQAVQFTSAYDLTGSHVRALDPAKPIAVFAGASQCRICGFASDHLYSQLMPTVNWGEHFAVVPYLGMGGDTFRVIALIDGTAVNFSTGASLSLNANEHVDQVLSVPALIEANKPIAVIHFNEGDECNPNGGDPSMAWVPPLDHLAMTARFRSITGPQSNLFTPFHYFNVVTAASFGPISLFLDNVDISASLQPVPSAPDHQYVRMSTTAGAHVITCAVPFQAQAYSVGTTAGIAFYAGYEPVPITLGMVQVSVPQRAACSVVEQFWLPPLKPEQTHAALVLYDAVGRVVLRTDNLPPNSAVDLGVLPEGIYHYTLFSAGSMLGSGQLLRTGQ